MKIAVLTAVAAFALPVPAVAQSLNDTHELVWNQAGKAPFATYRLRDKSPCAEIARHHQSGKGPLLAPAKCLAIAQAPTQPSPPVAN